MSGTAILIDVLGAVALMLWAVRMIRTGITRALGGRVHELVARVARNRVQGFVNGLLATLMVQSSMAMALIVSSLAARGGIDLVPGLAIMLGADVGSTLVAQALAFDIHWLSPICLVAGVCLFMSAEGGLRRHLGRFVIGVGLLLLALAMIKASSAPLREAGTLGQLLATIGGEPVIAILVAMLLTWLAHSSLAVVLLVMSLAAEGVISPLAALPLVLGANLGSALAAVVNNAAGPPAGRRVPIGNLAMRALGAAAMLPVLAPLADLLAGLDHSAARQVVLFHTGFNLAVALVFLPLLGPVGRLLLLAVPDADAPDDPGAPRHLDTKAIDRPVEALANASREALRMGDAAQAMLEHAMAMLTDADSRLLARIKAEEEVLDRMHRNIKIYLTQLPAQGLDEAESRLYVELLSLVTNLEHIGDIVDHNLLELASQRARYNVVFTREELAEIVEVHGLVVADLKLALGIFMTRDIRLARQLVDRKGRLRQCERDANDAHLERLRRGGMSPLHASGLHLDIIRDLKRVHSHIAAIAYPLLEAQGELASSRLVDRPEGGLAP